MCVNFSSVVMVQETHFGDFSECCLNFNKVVLRSVILLWSQAPYGDFSNVVLILKRFC